VPSEASSEGWVPNAPTRVAIKQGVLETSRPTPRQVAFTTCAKPLHLAASAALFFIASVALHADEKTGAPATNPSPAPASTDVLEGRGADEIRIREVFSSHLPGTMARDAFRASFHPRFGDLTNRDYFRVLTGVRYGATARLEVSAGADFYFSHGAGDVGFFDESGLYAVQFGAKFNAYKNVLSGWETGVGFDVDIPVGTPPPELTDGLKHFTPYITFSRRLPSRPRTRVFWGAGLDLVERTSFPGVLRENQLDDHSMGLTAGFVIDRNMMHYTFETQVATTRAIGDTEEDLLVLRPGFIWEVPKFRDRTRRSNWMIGLGGRVTIGPDGTDIGASAKLRYNLDLKQLFRRGDKSGE
jgi:hypothetical protein